MNSSEKRFQRVQPNLSLLSGCAVLEDRNHADELQLN
jgi:hypothetical protein